MTKVVDMEGVFSFFGSRLLQLLLFAIFFYFFGLSTLRKGMEKDVVVVSKMSFVYPTFSQKS